MRHRFQPKVLMKVDADCSTWNQQELFVKVSSNLELPENVFALSSTRRHLLADTVTVDFYIEPPEGDIYFTEDLSERINNDFSTGVAYQDSPDSLGDVQEGETRTTPPNTFKADDDSTVIIIGAACGAAALLGIGA
ncbi:hypothetical protein CYMTET_47682 [Cymbomonas tetramitiformis]|uniref:Uncharacterized protein n=1 Tax=Cymbomonas tetramitiformis TaxID=36881 RepID=A0AAE0EWD4_9CHLO|nr:hypothetical protein CYMTET_47682 [Cymbomonas tetramitiformis]